ncbi:6379_t:CDS:1, partial [Acaulospora colombiana]
MDLSLKYHAVSVRRSVGIDRASSPLRCAVLPITPIEGVPLQAMSLDSQIEILAFTIYKTYPKGPIHVLGLSFPASSK